MPKEIKQSTREKRIRSFLNDKFFEKKYLKNIIQGVAHWESAVAHREKCQICNQQPLVILMRMNMELDFIESFCSHTKLEIGSKYLFAYEMPRCFLKPENHTKNYTGDIIG